MPSKHTGLEEIEERVANLEKGKQDIESGKKSDRLLNITLAILTFSLLLMGVARFFYFPAVIEGRSMQETLQPEQKIWVKSKRFADLGRGSVVLFDNPFGEKTDAWYNIGELTNFEEPVRYVKRIIGVPGDTVMYSTDTVTVNGSVYYERGYDTLEGQEEFTVTLADDEYFVMGDNFDFSLDSRIFGPIKEGSIIGSMEQTEEEIKDYTMKHYYDQNERITEFERQIQEEREFTNG